MLTRTRIKLLERQVKNLQELTSLQNDSISNLTVALDSLTDSVLRLYIPDDKVRGAVKEEMRKDVKS